MQDVSKIFFLAFWVFSFTLVKSQDCSPDKIEYDHIQKSDLKMSYTNGESVKVNCATGYVGSYRLQCKDGEWITSNARECKKKPCGHPGDTSNGDFKLVQGSEFVFGARVQYSCRTGYEMASRVSYRDCHIQGWDNAVPICQVVKCSAITTSDDVIASGNTEDASYGDVVHFECTSDDKMLDAPADINCMENRQWSGKIPKCKDIECFAPVIPNGNTDHNRVYKENEIIEYTCKEGFSPRSGRPKCTKYDWTIQPECEETVCILYLPTTGVHSIEPKGITVFHAGESVEITCVRRFWVFGTKKHSKKVECQRNGLWSSRVVCEEITCEEPRVNNMKPYQYKPSYKLGERITIYCQDGYNSFNSQSTCGEYGWNPIPLCVEKRSCREFSLPNGYSYKLTQEKYLYSCDPDYKTYDGKWWGEVTCEQGQWSSPLCISDTQCGQVPTVFHATNQITKGYQNGEMQDFECEFGPCCFKCSLGQWENVDCGYHQCPDPPYVENAVIISREASTHETVTYNCLDNYSITGEQKISCTDSKWERAPTCTLESIGCPNPDEEINNALLDKTKPYTSRAEYKCKTGFRFENTEFATCSAGQWKYPQCVPLTGALKCQTPNKEISNGILDTENLSAQYPDGDQVKYKCKDGFKFKKDANAICSAGEWNYPQCISEIETPKCIDPEREINNATMRRGGLKAYYEEGGTLGYRCNEGFGSETVPQATCSGGQWIYPRCL